MLYAYRKTSNEPLWKAGEKHPAKRGEATINGSNAFFVTHKKFPAHGWAFYENDKNWVVVEELDVKENTDKTVKFVTAKDVREKIKNDCFCPGIDDWIENTLTKRFISDDDLDGEAAFDFGTTVDISPHQWDVQCFHHEMEKRGFYVERSSGYHFFVGIEKE